MPLIQKKYKNGHLKTYFCGIKISKRKFIYKNKDVSPERDNRNLTLSIVVPVYNAFDELKKLIASMEKANLSSQTEIIFIDDCSTDANVSIFLQTLQTKYKILKNSKNLGFIKTCNRGIKQSKGDIVVLLNSDTEIPDIFEQNILKCFKSDKNIAIASPLASHSGWWEIPCSGDELISKARRIDAGSAHQYPPFTPEGLCLCCRKEILRQIGLLDEIFGKGYCEEDDLVMRAIITGYRTVLIDDLFILHKRHASFTSDGRKQLFEHNIKIFNKRYGNLQGIVRKEMECSKTVQLLTKKIDKNGGGNTCIKDEQLSRYAAQLIQWYQNITQKSIDLDNPQTFNEKIQWLKLYASSPVKTALADKHLVRSWVEKKIGKECLIPLLGVYDDFEEIDFNMLPDCFVIKCNHGSGYNIIVKDKKKINLPQIQSQIKTWMNTNFAFHAGCELHYRDIKPKIIIEQYLDKINNSIYDYRFLCMDGLVEQIWLDINSGTPEHKRKIYDKNWNELNITVKWPRLETEVAKPDNLDTMIKYAEKLSQGFCFVRVDFYNINNRIYFGELTFTSMSGVGKFSPSSEDLRLGQKLRLPGLAWHIDRKEYFILPKNFHHNL